MDSGYIHRQFGKIVFTSAEISSYKENSTCHELMEPPEPLSHATQPTAKRCCITRTNCLVKEWIVVTQQIIGVNFMEQNKSIIQ